METAAVDMKRIAKAAKRIDQTLARHGWLGDEWKWLDAKERKRMRDAWERAIVKSLTEN